MRPKLICPSVVALILLAGSGMAAQQIRRTIVLPKMGGFERNVAAALQAQSVPVDVVTDKGKADLIGTFTPASSSNGNGALLYSKSGRFLEDIIEVVQVDSQRTVLRYRFFLMDDPDSRARAAEEFAQELRGKLVPKKKRRREAAAFAPGQCGGGLSTSG